MENKIKFIDIGGNEKIATVHHLRGTVLEVNGSTESITTGSGGGSRYDHLTKQNYIDPIKINTTNTKTLEIFLNDNAGKERLIRLTNWDIALRVGHELDLVWISCNDQSSPYLIVNNLTLGKYWYNYNNLTSIIAPDVTSFYQNKYKNRERILRYIIVGFLFLMFFRKINSWVENSTITTFIMLIPSLVVWRIVNLLMGASASNEYNNIIKVEKDKFIKALKPHIQKLNN
ncbi:hypothetical protein GCM10010099_05470 [Streptomyces cinereus]|nr:hypothetical protein GCM10010099_05470 [Streptomyces cinereus]